MGSKGPRPLAGPGRGPGLSFVAPMPDMLSRVFRVPEVRAGVAWLLGWYLVFALRSTRWRLEGAENLAVAYGRACVVAFWHERLPLMPRMLMMARRAHPGLRACVLVSRHRDGQVIARVLARFRAEVVHGSSSRGGAAGMR